MPAHNGIAFIIIVFEMNGNSLKRRSEGKVVPLSHKRILVC
jgi:hypothetical protein